MWAKCRVFLKIIRHCKYFTRVLKRLNYPGADKSLGRPTSRCILFDGENISFDASLVIYINIINIPWDARRRSG